MSSWGPHLIPLCLIAGPLYCHNPFIPTSLFLSYIYLASLHFVLSHFWWVILPCLMLPISPPNLASYRHNTLSSRDVIIPYPREKPKMALYYAKVQTLHQIFVSSTPHKANSKTEWGLSKSFQRKCLWGIRKDRAGEGERSWSPWRKPDLMEGEEKTEPWVGNAADCSGSRKPRSLGSPGLIAP